MEFFCSICPKSCRINVSEDGKITNAMCEKGESEAKNELVNPRRILTTTVKTVFGIMPVVSVKTDRPIEKSAINEVMKKANAIVVSKPLTLGEVVYENIIEGVNLISTVNMTRRFKK